MISLDSIEFHFRENFEKRGELGASVSVWKDGEEVLSLADGWTARDANEKWTTRTLVPVWSATKGPAAITTLLALHEGGISPHEEVSKLWPELKAARDSGLTFLQLLSHQSGLCALSPDNRPDMLDRKAVCRALEIQEPFWKPGTAHGYHPRTIGFLLDEIVRRSSGGIPLGKYWNEKIATPLSIDFWIGNLPEEAIKRLATIYPPALEKPTSEEAPFYRALGTQNPESMSLAAFSSPNGLVAMSNINKPEFLQAGLPSLGGAGSASALAKFYGLLISKKENPSIPCSVKQLLGRSLSSGNDLTLLLPTRFSAGFMLDPVAGSGEKSRHLFGPSKSAFGQPGAGGSHAFGDPETGIAFAYVMNKMDVGILPNEKALGFIPAIYD